MLSFLRRLWQLVHGPDRKPLEIVASVPLGTFSKPNPPKPREGMTGEPKVDNLDLVRPNFNPQYVIVHHSLTRDGQVVDWSAIKRYHMETNGWSDIGYHFGVERVIDEYQVMLGRPMLRVGAHTKDGNFNHMSLGVCVVGNFDLGPVPVEQWQLALKLVKRLCWFLKIPYGHVLGHREAQAAAGLFPNQRKTCPGTQFNMDAFRANLVDVC